MSNIRGPSNFGTNRRGMDGGVEFLLDWGHHRKRCYYADPPVVDVVGDGLSDAHCAFVLLAAASLSAVPLAWSSFPA